MQGAQHQPAAFRTVSCRSCARPDPHGARLMQARCISMLPLRRHGFMNTHPCSPMAEPHAKVGFHAELLPAWIMHYHDLLRDHGCPDPGGHESARVSAGPVPCRHCPAHFCGGELCTSPCPQNPPRIWPGRLLDRVCRPHSL